MALSALRGAEPKPTSQLESDCQADQSYSPRNEMGIFSRPKEE
jgi:hypothetical protein